MLKSLLAQRIRPLLLVSILFASCGHLDSRDLLPIGDGIKSISRINFDSLARGIADSAGGGIKETLADTISANNLNASIRRLAHSAIAGLQDSLLDTRTRLRLDSAVTELLDTLNSPHNQQNLSALIKHVGGDLGAMLDTLLGRSRGQQLSDLVNKYLLGDATTTNLLHLRDTLLGSKLDSLFQRLGGKVMDTLTWGVRNQLTPALDTALAHSGKQVSTTTTTIAWILGIVAALLMGLGTFLWFLKRRYQNMTELLTQEIHKIPDQRSYDELVGRIHEKAIDRKLEPHLKTVLEQQGILGKAAWRPKPKSSDS